MKILISYDGSYHANAALKDLLKAGLPVEAQAVVMSIPKFSLAEGAKIEGDSRTDAPAFSEEEIEEAAAMSKQASDIIRENFPAWEVRADLAVGSTVRVVAKKAGQWNPDLIVLGLQDGAESGRPYFGDVSRRIAIEAKCSVRVARGINAETDEAPRVLLCVDGSQYTEAAVSAVASRDWPKGTEVRILTVVNPFDYSIPEFLDKALERAESFHRIIANELDRTPAFTSSVVLEGEPEKLILKVADEWRPDSIFIAPHDGNRFSRFLPGGVSGTVVARAKCTVELARIERPSRFVSTNPLSVAGLRLTKGNSSGEKPPPIPASLFIFHFPISICHSSFIRP
jgi:nucleotide-binding universal stress UspA family protein